LLSFKLAQLQACSASSLLSFKLAQLQACSASSLLSFKLAQFQASTNEGSKNRCFNLQNHFTIHPTASNRFHLDLPSLFHLNLKILSLFPLPLAPAPSINLHSLHLITAYSLAQLTKSLISD
jgi:hypothetical protein